MHFPTPYEATGRARSRAREVRGAALLALRAGATLWFCFGENCLQADLPTKIHREKCSIKNTEHSRNMKLWKLHKFCYIFTWWGLWRNKYSPTRWTLPTRSSPEGMGNKNLVQLDGRSLRGAVLKEWTNQNPMAVESQIRTFPSSFLWVRERMYTAHAEMVTFYLCDPLT